MDSLTINQTLPPQIPLVGEPDECCETLFVGPAALPAGTILGVVTLDDELAVPWHVGDDPLAFVLGVTRHALPAADAGVTSREVVTVAGDCLVALDTLPELQAAQASAPAKYRHVYRQLSARGIRITERAGD